MGGGGGVPRGPLTLTVKKRAEKAGLVRFRSGEVCVPSKDPNGGETNRTIRWHSVRDNFRKRTAK